MTENSVAIVTGAGAGIGLALARALAAQGSEVVLADVDADAICAEADRLRASGARAFAVPTDVADPEAVRALVEGTAARAGRIDRLFNNAGVNVVGEALHVTLDDWRRLVAINLMGVVHGVHFTYPILVRQGFGHIVNVSSMAGILPAPFQVAYAATKHAIVGLSLALRAEAERHGVLVSVVCPGWIDTRMKETQRVVGADRERVIAAVPFGYAPPEQCAREILAGVRRNRAMILVTRFPKWAHRVQRWAPGLVQRIAAGIARRGL